MNVKTLNQFLHNLITPLQESKASDEIVADLNQITATLNVFADKPISELAQFLNQARDYEREGHWPESAPAIEGEVVDKPSPQAYAARLQQYLRKTVPAEGAMPVKVLDELESLKKAMPAAQLKEMAKACGVTGNITTGPAAIDKAFAQITGQKLADAIVEVHASSLQQEHADEPIETKLARVQKLTITQIRAIAKKIGVGEKIANNKDGIDKIKTQLQNPPTETTAPGPRDFNLFEPEVSKAKIDQIVETLQALKEKADPEGAPYAEIEEELNRLAEEMTVAEAIAAAKQFEVPWSVNSKAEAVKRIREKVLERKLVREKIRY